MRILYALLALLVSGSTAQALNIRSYPKVDFGNFAFVPDSTLGAAQIMVSPEGAVSNIGSGGIVSQSRGLAARVELTTTSSAELLVNLKVLKTTPQIINTPGCGQVIISNITLEGNKNFITKNCTSGVFQATVGATLQVSSLSSSNCTLSGSVVGALGYSTLSGDLNPATALDLQIIAFVLPPPLVLTHQNNAQLDFGRSCTNSIQTQTVTVTPEGNTSGTNLSCGVPNGTADVFKITGSNNGVFSVNPIANTTIQNTTDGRVLNVSQLTPSCSTNCTMAGTSTTLKVGGTLTIPTGTTPGRYNGTYQVTIIY